MALVLSSLYFSPNVGVKGRIDLAVRDTKLYLILSYTLIVTMLVILPVVSLWVNDLKCGRLPG